MSDFSRYADQCTDDSPLYVFDSRVLETNPTISEGYTPPIYFANDHWSHLSESRRPPYKWLLMAPRQSGTTVHIDPLATSAWNTVVTGSKRWVLFPPEAGKDLVKAKQMYGEGEDDEAANYFMKVLPKLRSSGVPCYEFTQGPGETLYVPSGWWHGVLNLEAGVGVTMNFCDDYNFEGVWRSAREGRRKR